MAEVLGLTSPILGVLQAYRNALENVAPSDGALQRLLSQYNLAMSILEDCARTMQTSMGERLMSDSIIQATHQCTELGAEIAFRQEKIVGKSFKNRIAFVLAPWDKLRALHTDFRSSVLLLHSLTKDLFLREIVEGQQELRRLAAETMAANNAVLENMEKGPVHRQERRGQGILASSMSTMTGRSQFTVSQDLNSDVATFAEKAIAGSIARGIQFDNDPSLTFGTIFVTREDKPKFVPVRAKFDTASDVNFIPSLFVQEHGLTSLLVQLEGDDDSDTNVFLGLNDQEYVIHHTITLQWSATTMHRVRTTLFHVSENLPYDLLLGNPFIQENRVFHPARVALPLRKKKVDTRKRAAEAKEKEEHQSKVAIESSWERNEDAARRALEREARRLAKEQTSASSMITTSSSTSYSGPSSSATILPSDSNSHVSGDYS